MRILLIEDDREAAAYIVRGLAESGHRVDLASQGREGLERARQDRFDAMIIDRMLPEFDGLSIVAALRAARDATPVLVLSALGDVEDRVTG
ncbi:MAG: response regulator, partial [Stellaceae bacterium]